MNEYYGIYRKEFYQVTRHLIKAVSKDRIRPAINQLHIGRKGDIVTMAATDGHRVHRIHHRHEGLDFQFALPRSFVELLRTEYDCLDGAIVIEGDGDAPLRLKARIHNHEFEVTNTDYTFPPVDQAIPKACYIEDTVNVKPFRKLLREVAKLIPERNYYKVVITSNVFEDPRLLTFTAPDGQYREFEVPESAWKANSDAKPISMGVNLSYMIDALGPLKCETVNIKWSGPLDPIVITSGDQDATKNLDWTFDCAIMPMRF
jgi:DNA polymerase III sliding clamp (beta) subunit (PCNA family)